MINEIFEKAAEELNALSFYQVSLNEFMYNFDSTQTDKYPAIVLFNDIQTNENINAGGRYAGTEFITRWLFCDKIQETDETGDNILEVQDNMRTLARQYILNITRVQEFQDLNNNQQSLTFNTTAFAKDFDNDLAGVFVNFNFFLTLPIDYCKFIC